MKTRHTFVYTAASDPLGAGKLFVYPNSVMDKHIPNINGLYDLTDAISAGRW